MPLVTVILPVYNAEMYLKEAISSILNQTYPNFEFIIINDGSTDDSVNIIKSFTDQRIILIENDKNIGLTATLNKGLSLANGKYILRMDQDDISLPKRIQIQVSFMENNPEIGICGSARIVIRDGKKVVFNNNVKTHGEIKSFLLFQNCIAHPTVIMRKSELLDKELMYESYHAEDYDLWSRAVLKTKMANITEPLLIYREHPHQMSQTKILEHEKTSREIQKKMFSKLGLLEVTVMLLRYMLIKVKHK